MVKKRFMLKEIVEVKVGRKVGKIEVSTAYVDARPLLVCYETMLFETEDSKVGFDLEHQWRFKDKEQAIKHHKKIVRQFKQGRIKVVPSTYDIRFGKKVPLEGSVP